MPSKQMPDDQILSARLTDRSLLREQGFIGDWRDADQRFDVTDPATGATIAQVARMRADDASAAVDAAQVAFPDWSGVVPQTRSAALRRWFELIMENSEDLALIMVAEQGKPLSEARGEIEYGAGFVEFYAEEAKRPDIRGVTSHLPDAEVDRKSVV